MHTYIIFLVVFIVGIIVYFVQKKAEQDDAVRTIDKRKKLKCYDYAGEISVYSRSLEYKDLITYRQHKKVMYENVPEQYIYTSATVGGITTGGVSKVDGYVDAQASQTDRYEMVVKDVETDSNGNKRVVYKGIQRIKLSKELLEIAKKSRINKYLDGEYIVIVNPVYMPPELASMEPTMAVNIATSLQVKGYPTASKCQEILSWLCGV